MKRLPMSRAGAALLRVILSRAETDHDRILLTDYRSSDWQSLILVGERHEMWFRIHGPDAKDIYSALTGNLSNAEFSMPKQLIADIAVFGLPEYHADGSISLRIEALTIESD